METLTRKPFEGVKNIVRFNWPFFVLAGSAVLALVVAALFAPFRYWTVVGAALVLTGTVVPLAVSYWVYDRSRLYRFNWLPAINGEAAVVVNIHAGFDETSALLRQRFPSATLHVFDFYNPKVHTEASIQRARAHRTPYPGTVRVQTTSLPQPSRSADAVFCLLSAHEIRNDDERIAFFREINRLLKPGGTVTVVEHLRDVRNLLAYHIGFFHFLPALRWRKTFANAGLRITRQRRITPFLTVYTLHGSTD